MYYGISPEIFGVFPGFQRAVIFSNNVSNSSADPDLERRLREEILRIASDKEISVQHPRIQAWTDAYERMKLRKSDRVRPSIYTLITRIKSGKGDRIPFISSMVCISNLVSLNYLVPSGVIDGSRVTGDLELGYASGNELFEPIGSEEVISIEPGEIIYRDSTNTVFCRGWNSRVGRPAMLNARSQICIMDIDCFSTLMKESELQEAMDMAVELIEKFCNAKCQTFVLKQQQRAAEFFLADSSTDLYLDKNRETA